MLLTRHYNERPFKETACDALIANDDVIKPSNKIQNVCDGKDIKHDSDCSCVCNVWHTVHSNELFAMRIIAETVIQMKVCVIYNMQFTRMN